ncbi:transposase [Xanthomonas fragariae LMG 25863]|nr:transposase [Xanthomonas fragariae LMG 25863]
MLEWEAAGFFEVLWKAGLAEYDQMQGIAWRWQSVDGAMMKASLAQQAVGPNPTDRGKKAASATCWWTAVALDQTTSGSGTGRIPACCNRARRSR